MQKQEQKSSGIFKKVKGFIISLTTNYQILNSGIRGQVMLITVLIMSGVMLSATAIGGYLVLNQLRQATFSANSAQAISAADSGIECELYNLFKNGGVDCSTQTFNGKVPVTVNTTTTIAGTSTIIRSTGGAANTYRAFEVIVENPP